MTCPECNEELSKIEGAQVWACTFCDYMETEELHLARARDTLAPAEPEVAVNRGITCGTPENAPYPGTTHHTGAAVDIVQGTPDPRLAAARVTFPGHQEPAVDMRPRADGRANGVDGPETPDEVDALRDMVATFDQAVEDAQHTMDP